MERETAIFHAASGQTNRNKLQQPPTTAAVASEEGPEVHHVCIYLHLAVRLNLLVLARVIVVTTLASKTAALTHFR